MAFEFESNLPEVNRQLERNLRAALIAGSEMIRSQAKANVTRDGRVDSGQLRDSIAYRVNRDGESAVIGSPLDHAIYNEFGTGEFAENGRGRHGGWTYRHPSGRFVFTRGMTGIKFLRNAFRTRGNQAQAEIARAMGEGLND